MLEQDCGYMLLIMPQLPLKIPKMLSNRDQIRELMTPRPIFNRDHIRPLRFSDPQPDSGVQGVPALGTFHFLSHSASRSKLPSESNAINALALQMFPPTEETKEHQEEMQLATGVSGQFLVPTHGSVGFGATDVAKSYSSIVQGWGGRVWSQKKIRRRFRSWISSRRSAGH